MQTATAYKVGNFEKGQVNGSVSRQWISRPADQKFLSLGDLKANVDARRDASVELTIPAKRIELIAPERPTSIEQTHDLQIGLPNGDLVNPTHWSFGQIAGLAGAPAKYLRSLPSQIVADALAYGMRFNREIQDVKLYSSRGDVLAATGPDYGRIFDSEVVAAVQQVAGNGTGDTRWKVPGMLDWSAMTYDPEHPVSLDTTTLYASDRDVFMFLVDDRNPIEVGKLPNGDPDLMFRGFYITNSEVGSGSLKLAAFYLRAVCMNRNLWGVEGFEELTMRHSKYAPSRFIEQARPALESFANGSTGKLIEGVKKAKAARLASNDEEALDFLAGRGFSRKMAAAVIEAAEVDEAHPPRSAWDFAQGITRVARDLPNNDTRIELEGEARKLLDKVA